MLNQNSAAFFSLAVRTFGATDQPGVKYPDMVGVIRVGDQEIHTVAWLEIDETNGMKFARFTSVDLGEGVSFSGKLFRDETVPGKPQYRGFLRQAIQVREGSAVEFVYMPWQLEISAEHRMRSSGGQAIEGWCFPLNLAPKYSVNAIIKESKQLF